MDPSVVARLNNLYWSIGTIAFIVAGSALVGLMARRVAAFRGGSLRLQRRTFWGYAMASPWILGFVIFVLGPSLASLYYSLTDYRLGQAIEWSGLDNYRTLLGGLGAHGRRFMQAMYNSFYYAVVGVPLQIATSLIMAMLVARALPGMRFFRLVFYLPVILAGGPAILLAWRYMLASNGGFVNVTLKSIADAFAPFDWLYRTWIFLMEAFNAFYAGLVRNDPVGPLMYLVPALVGFGLCAVLALVRDDTLRRSIAATAAEVLITLRGPREVLDGVTVRGGNCRYRTVTMRHYAEVTRIFRKEERGHGTVRWLPPVGPRERDDYVFSVPDGGWSSITVDVLGDRADELVKEVWLTGYEATARQTTVLGSPPMDGPLWPMHPHGFSRHVRMK